MKQLPVLVFTFLFHVIGFSQNNYWQQQVNYNIDVSLNDADNTLHGFEKIEYINNSPDTLTYIWFHIWPNAYKDETTAFYKQLTILKDGKRKIRNFKERGYIDSLSFKEDGENIRFENHPDYNDVIKLFLLKPLYPGGHTILTTPFFVKIPSYISRLGHDGQSYMITQWYPKPAVYDKKGWHAMPYLDMGEFYSEYGSYDVNITVPSSYVVAATGILETQNEKEFYQTIGKKNKQLINAYKNNKQEQKIKSLLTYYYSASEGTKTLSWHADSVHDFAWFADKNFVINYDTLQLASGKIIDAYTFYHASDKEWYSSEDDVEDIIRRYSLWIGEYAYPVVNAVEGPSNSSSGGMEYPMITLITEPNANDKKLDGILAHEVGHNWFYAMLGTNERDNPWMDEGVNTYFEFKYEGEKYHSNLVFGNAIPQRVKDLDEEHFFASIYNTLNQIPMYQPVASATAAFNDDEEYSSVVYLKTAIWMYTIELSIGSDKLQQAIHGYFRDWKFKHPTRADMKASFENSTGIDFSKLFALLDKAGNFR
jgi:aminopeptidase N